jgi:hypothetical protein
VHLTKLGAVVAAAVAAGVHRGGEEVGSGEAADEDRDEQAPYAPRARHSATFVEGNAAGCLGAGEALYLLDENGDELYRDHED